MALFGRLLERLSRPAEEIRAELLRAWVSSLPNVTPISEANPRTRCRVGGVVQNIRIDPTEGTGAIEATLTDGSGQMVAKWLGRSSLSGVRLGIGLVIEGTAGVGEHGELVILNPEYELHPGPEHHR
jgi:RecG wedge domain